MSGMTLNAGADVVAKAGQDGFLPSPIPPGPQGRVFVCFALMFATVKVCNIWLLTLPQPAPSHRLLLPSGGSLTWDRKYKTCLIFDKAGKESGSESSISR